MVIHPQGTIRASTAQHARRLVPPVVVRTGDPRVIYGFGSANFQAYVKVTLCDPSSGAAVDDDNPLVGGASQMITQRHARSYTFDMRDPAGPYVYFVFGDLCFERLGEFAMAVDMQVVDYRCPCVLGGLGVGGRPGGPLRYGGEAVTRPFTVVEDAITRVPRLLCMSLRHEARRAVGFCANVGILQTNRTGCCGGWSGMGVWRHGQSGSLGR